MEIPANQLKVTQDLLNIYHQQIQEKAAIIQRYHSFFVEVLPELTNCPGYSPSQAKETFKNIARDIEAGEPIDIDKP